MTQFGRLEAVALRDGWPREDYDFTPWLAENENLELLGKAIGMSLEFFGTESTVGPFRADVVAKCAGSEDLVVIENQFGTTDHSHLGQLLTYAAGLGGTSGPKAVVWVAEKFTEPHRAALDWLNQHTDTAIGFFGVQLELWRIGESLLAPRFNVVSRPNAFQKELTQQAAALSETDRDYQRFWQGFIDYCGQDTLLDMPSAPPQYWIPTYIGRVGYGVNLTASKRHKRLECQLWLDGKNAKHSFAELQARKQEVITCLGEKIIYDDMTGKKSSKIYETKQGDIGDEEKWPELYDWLKRRGEAFVSTFKPLVQSLP